MSTVDDGQRSNKQNLGRLRKESYFDKKVTTYKIEKDAVNLEKPSDEVIASNRKEVQSYLIKKKISTLILIVSIVLVVLAVIYFMS